MNENSDLLPNLASQEDAFEVQLRGYSRRQVDEFVARCRSQVRELEERLGRSLDDSEQLRQEVKALRQQALGNRPAHEEVSERISQILKLADDEARAQKTRADDDIKKQLADAQQEADRTKKEARDQAEHMLTAAQEQAERAISTARADADKTRNAARAEADHTTGDALKKADSVLSSAKAQAKQTLDEATARATAIHDGAERRLNLLSTRHGETIRRLTEILDGVSGLVAAETSRLSLEDEVDQDAAKAIAQKAGESGADSPGPKGAPAQARNVGSSTPLGAAAAATGGQRVIPGNPAAARPGNGARTDNPPAAPARPRPRPRRPRAWAASRPFPAVALTKLRAVALTRRREVPGPPRPRRAAPASASGLPGASRMAGSAPAAQATPGAPGAAGQGGPRTPEDMGANRRPAGPGNGHRTNPDGSLTGSIDADETTEGVRIVREQRQH